MNTVSASPVEGLSAPSRRTIDAPTRVFHGLMALSFVGAYASADSERWRLLHITLGYTMLGLMGFRLVWFLMGPKPSRWQAWRARWQAAKQSVSALFQGAGRVAPLVAGAQTALLLAVLVAAMLVPLSGHALDQGWWGDALEDVHEAAGEAMLALVLAHITVALVSGWARSNNPLKQMLTGRVPGSGPDLVPHNRAWLAAAMLALVLAFWWNQWQSGPTPGSPLDRVEWRAHHHPHHHDDDDDD